MAIVDGTGGFVAGLGDTRSLLRLPDWPAVATAATLAAKLRGLAEVAEVGAAAQVRPFIDQPGGQPPYPATAGQPSSMMALGLFVFGMTTLAYQEFSRKAGWRHTATERFGATAAWQYVGPGDQVVTLPGLLVPEFAGDMASFTRLEEMAATGDAYPLVESTGTILGQFVIRGLDTKRTMFLPGGIAKRIEFTIDLARVDG